MARGNSTINLTGKVDDKVYVNSKYGHLVRKAPINSSKKDEPALQQQYNRTAFLNTLAGELNSIIGVYSGTLKAPRFYQALQKRFRKEPLNNRFLLLKQLEGMEVNSTYTLGKLGDAKVAVRSTEKKMTVALQVLFHPSKFVSRYEADCYAYEVSLLCWKKGAGRCSHARQFSEWIYLTDGLPEFEFSFKRPAGTVHWLVCLKQQLAIREEPIPSFCAEGMQIVSAGSFDQKDLTLLHKREEEKMAQAANNAAKKEREKIIRVKAKTKKI